MRTIAFLGVLMFFAHSYGEDVRIVPGVEGLQQLEEEGITSRLKFRNAEAIVTYTSETRSTDPGVTEPAKRVQRVARVLLDFELERCFHVSSSQRLNDSGSSKRFSYVIYRDGKGKDNLEFAVAESGREGFFKYLGASDVERIEYAGSGFNQAFSVWTPEKLVEETLSLMQKYNEPALSKTIKQTQLHPNGNKEYVLTLEELENRQIKTYNPKYVLPIEWVVTRKIKEAPEDILHSKVEYEDINGFTRCKSLVCDRIDTLIPETLEKEHISIDYQWLQFNEDNLKWPDEQQVIASNESMQAYLENKN